MTSTPQQRPKVGLALGLGEGMMAGETPRWQDILTMARLAEDAGFDSLWLADHFLSPSSETTRTVGWWECGSMLAALAAATSRITLGAIVFCTSFRSPALLAKMADTIDEISGGRLILGIGSGWNDAEFSAFGYPTTAKLARFEEAAQIIHGLLKHGERDFEGSYYTIRQCELRPRGPRSEGPPIMIGATGPKMMRIAARYADIWNGWLPSRPVEGKLVPGPSHPAAVLPLRTALDTACKEVGRDPASLRRTVGVIAVVKEDLELPLSCFGEPIQGSTEEIAEVLLEFAQEGISELQVRPIPHSPSGVEAFAPVLEILARYPVATAEKH